MCSRGKQSLNVCVNGDDTNRIFRRTTRAVFDYSPEIHHVPVTEQTLERITKSFRIHRCLGPMINRADAKFEHCVHLGNEPEANRLCKDKIFTVKLGALEIQLIYHSLYLPHKRCISR